MKLSEFTKIWQLAKPVIIMVISITCFLTSNQLTPKLCALAIIILSIVFRGAAIWAGIEAIGFAIKRGIPEDE